MALLARRLGLFDAQMSNGSRSAVKTEQGMNSIKKSFAEAITDLDRSPPFFGLINDHLLIMVPNIQQK
ncbi:MAG: hypothetical protein M1398_03180 [Deltaproteobacteria bacterium]|nr:hypothetical protein [Deltaproteobacteria bacterium]